MERRGFLKLISGGVAGIVLNQAIPFNRVWSFPKEIIIPEIPITRFGLDLAYGADWSALPIGTLMRIRMPERFIVKEDIFDFSKPPRYRFETYLGGPLPEGIQP